MAGKDQLLNDIKNKRIGSYDTVNVELVRIFVKPVSIDLVTLDYFCGGSTSTA